MQQLVRGRTGRQRLGIRVICGGGRRRDLDGSRDVLRGRGRVVDHVQERNEGVVVILIGEWKAERDRDGSGVD
jgi:hypothetical protein